MIRATDNRAIWPAAGALIACALLGVTFVVLYPDSYQQDGGTHYLFARWAWTYPTYLIDVWGRPLFTGLYSLPARFGYVAAKTFTVAICVATAWQTWRYAIDEGLERPALVIPFLWLQPSFMLLSSETMTEPLCALLLVVALRLQRSERRSAAAVVMSATVLVRPEGVFLCALWAVWLFMEPHSWRDWRPRLTTAVLLGLGPALWWVAGLAVTHDIAFIRHNWPTNWSPTGSAYGRGPFLNFYYRRAEILGPLLQVPFAVGLILAVARRQFGLVVAIVAAFFVVHSVLWATGAFGSAGYPRYFVCVAPAIAMLTLLGWNGLVSVVRGLAGSVARPLVIGATSVVLAVSTLSAATYVDNMTWTRDSRIVDDAYGWFHEHPRSFHSLFVSQAYMCVRFDCDPKRSLVQGPTPGLVLGRFRAATPGTLVVWDFDTGPNFSHGVTGDSIIALGYTPLHVVSDTLYGRFVPLLAHAWFVPHTTAYGWNQPRIQRIWLLYKH